MKHTKTPWIQKGCGIYSGLTLLACTGDDETEDGPTADEQEANAAFIAEACNSYIELVNLAIEFRAHSIMKGYDSEDDLIQRIDRILSQYKSPNLEA